MRYLAPIFQESTLRRGKSLEQFLGSGTRRNENTIRCLELRPTALGVEVWLHEAADIGDERHLDYYPFIYHDDVNGDPVAAVALLDSPAAALEFAVLRLGVSPSRWTNLGVSQDEYLDFIKAGRPAQWPISVEP